MPEKGQITLTPSQAAKLAYEGDGKKETYADIYADTVSALMVKREQYIDIATKIIPGLQLRSDSLVMELGPGKVPHLPQVLESFGLPVSSMESGEQGIKFIGIDNYRKMMNTDPDFPINMIQANAGIGIPLSDKSVDVVVINSVLLSLDKPTLPTTLRELYRVIKEDGIIVISELDEEVGEGLTNRVINREKQLLHQQVSIGATIDEILIRSARGEILEDEASNSSFIKEFIYFTQLAGRFLRLIRNKRISDEANRYISESNQGFNLIELETLLNDAGFTVEEVGRTYADSYHLVKARRLT